MDWQLISGLVFLYLAIGYGSAAFQIKRYDAQIQADRLHSQVLDDVEPGIQRMAMIITGVIVALTWPAYVFSLLTGGFDDEA